MEKNTFRLNAVIWAHSQISMLHLKSVFLLKEKTWKNPG